jgi:IS5 family transposase
VNNPSKPLKFAHACLGVVKKKVRKHSSKYSRKDFTQWQLLTLLCTMKRYRLKYREFVEILQVSSELTQFLELKKIPHWTTLNKFFLRMQNALLSLLVELSACNDVIEASIDASGYDRHYASKHYVRRCKMTFGDLKVTKIIDVERLSVHRIHCTTTRRHDSQIVLSLVDKTAAKLLSLYADAGYDAKFIRDSLRSHGTRPVIKHRVFWNIDKAHNARLKNYGKRSMSETVNSMIKRKYGDFVSCRTWNNQFKEMNLKCLVHNIDLMLILLRGFLRSQTFLLKGEFG